MEAGQLADTDCPPRDDADDEDGDELQVALHAVLGASPQVDAGGLAQAKDVLIHSRVVRGDSIAVL